MKRITVTPRNDWENTVKAQGLAYSETLNEKTGVTTHYWNENVAYQFTMNEVLKLEKTTETLHQMSVEDTKFLAEEQTRLYSPWKRMGIPEHA